MASLDTIATDVASAKVYSIEQMALQITLMKNGSATTEICDLTALKRLIRCLQFQINAGVVDADTNTLYVCLLNQLAGFNHAYTIDPEVKIPGQDVTVIIAGSKVNSAIIPFTNQTTVSLARYQTTYLPTYGPNPTVQIFVAVGDGTYAQDEGTAPIYTYVTPGNPSSGITSITWGYGVATSGYVQISGVMP